MGCFNKIGFVSGLPIQCGDKTVLIFLDGKNNSEEKSGVVYSDDFFAPTLFPIFGNYDDYGKIENIIRDENVKFIEDLFGVDIDYLVEAVDDKSVGRYQSEKYKVKKNKELFNKLTFALEKKEVYDFMASKKRTSWNISNVGQYWLNKFGFILQEEKSRDDRYTKKYIHPEIKKFDLLSDGTWSHFVKKGTIEAINVEKYGTYGTYHPEQLFTVMTGMDVKMNISEQDKNMCLCDLSFDLHINSLSGEKRDLKELNKRFEELCKNKDQDEATLKEIESLIKLIDFSDFSPRYLDGVEHITSLFSNNQAYGIVKTCRDFMSNKKAKKSVTNYTRFNWYLSRINGKYFPSNYGSQEQELANEYKPLYDMYSKILKKEIKAREYEQDDE